MGLAHAQGWTCHQEQARHQPHVPHSLPIMIMHTACCIGRVGTLAASYCGAGCMPPLPGSAPGLPLLLLGGARDAGPANLQAPCGMGP